MNLSVQCFFSSIEIGLMFVYVEFTVYLGIFSSFDKNRNLNCYIFLTQRPSFALQTNERFIDGIISFAHAPVNVTDFSIGSINCVRYFRKRKYKLPSSNQSILPYMYSQTYQNRNKSWKPECVLSFNMDWRILVNFIPRFWLGIKY